MSLRKSVGKTSAARRSWRARNRDKIRTWKRRWATTANGRRQAREWYRKSPSAMYPLYRKSAAKRGIGFDITKKEFVALIVLPCVYCGQKTGGFHPRNGLDRIDNKRGYLADNVSPCCFVCNQMKGKMTVSEFLEHVRKILLHRGEGNDHAAQ